jgi:hypothetical protein
MNDIKHIRLINGEEVIAEVLEPLDSQTVCVTNPMLVSEQSTDDGGYQAVLVSYVPFSVSKTIFLKNDHIITISDLHKEMERHYHYSLKLTCIANTRMIKQIAAVNDAMQSALLNTSDNVDQSRLFKAPSSLQ